MIHNKYKINRCTKNRMMHYYVMYYNYNQKYILNNIFLVVSGFIYYYETILNKIEIIITFFKVLNYNFPFYNKRSVTFYYTLNIF